MNELMDRRRDDQNVRRQLLSTVSALIMTAYVPGTGNAIAHDDQDKPTVWVELGGQLERVSSSQESFAPPFVGVVEQAGFEFPLKSTRPPRFSFGGEAAISFEPEDTDWVFSATVRYGRSNGQKNIHRQVTNVTHYTLRLGPPPGGTKYRTKTGKEFSEIKAAHREAHTIVDFQAGKDVGLGFLGKPSVLSLGVRFAQFTTGTTQSLNARPDAHFTPQALGPIFTPAGIHHTYAASESETRSFRGVGPSLSLEGAATLIGEEDNRVTADWGVDAAVLFGRQKTKAQHQTSGRYFHEKYGEYGGHYPTFGYHQLYNHPRVTIVRNKSVVIPDLGGFAGISMRFPNAKLSIGYKVDFFLGAMDGGIDLRRAYNRAFYGPYATISVGLGG